MINNSFINDRVRCRESVFVQLLNEDPTRKKLKSQKKNHICEHQISLHIHHAHWAKTLLYEIGFLTPEHLRCPLPWAREWKNAEPH